jgi:predicted SprT family Zn-dependent metalloprotease
MWGGCNLLKRKLLSIVLAVCLATGGVYSQSGRVASPPLTHQYRKYNHEFFEDKLPKDLIVYWGPAGGDHFIAYTYHLGEPDVWIEMNPKYNLASTETFLNLLHEMCHVSVGQTFDAHGPKWQKCMHNLADVGAFDDLW